MIFGKYVNQFYKKYFFAFLIGLVALVAVDYAQLILPELVGKAVSNMQNGVDYHSYLNSFVKNIIIVGVTMCVGRFLWRIALYYVACKVQLKLGQQIFYKTTELSQNDFYKYKVGELMSLMSYDIENIQDAMSFAIMNIVDFFFLGGLTIFKMFSMNVTLSLFCVVPIILLVVAGGIIEKVLTKAYEQRQESLDHLSDFTQESFSGIRVVKAFVQEKFESLYAKKLGIECKDKEVKLTKANALVECIITIIISSAMFLILGVGSYLIYLKATGKNISLDAGEIVTFTGYFDALVWPMMALGNMMTMRSRAKSSLKRISKVLDLPKDIKEGNVEINSLEGNIEFKDLTFKYNNDSKEVLKHVSFKLNKGETLGIVGRVGSGKSTILDILARLYNVEKGKVFIDGIDIMDFKVQNYRNLIAYVPQENLLFSKSVQENIAFSGDYSFDKIKEAAEFASLEDNINLFSDGYETIIGEKGVSLSGGQKQRLAIARAYIKNASIMMLDDSVSAVDVKTEKDILNNIYNNRKGKTTIIVASRVSVVEHLDKILVLNDGVIEGFGSHKELMEKSPLYKNMVQIQKFQSKMNGDEK